MEIRNFEDLCMNCEIIGKNDGECCRYCFITTLKNDGYKIENKFEISQISLSRQFGTEAKSRLTQKSLPPMR